VLHPMSNSTMTASVYKIFSPSKLVFATMANAQLPNLITVTETPSHATPSQVLAKTSDSAQQPTLPHAPCLECSAIPMAIVNNAVPTTFARATLHAPLPQELVLESLAIPQVSMELKALVSLHHLCV